MNEKEWESILLKRYGTVRMKLDRISYRASIVTTPID